MISIAPSCLSHRAWLRHDRSSTARLPSYHMLITVHQKGVGLFPRRRFDEPAQRLYGPFLPRPGGLHAHRRVYLRRSLHSRSHKRATRCTSTLTAVSKFSLPEASAERPRSQGTGSVVGMILALLLGGLIAALFAYLIGLPVLRLKSDYLAIATLGFAEIIRAIFQWNATRPAHQRLEPSQGLSALLSERRRRCCPPVPC